MTYYIIFAIVVLLIILFISNSQSTYNEFYKGIWTSSEAFCKDAGIDEMILYIGNQDSKGAITTTHGGYLIIRADGMLVENKYVLIDVTPSISSGNIRKYTVTIRDDESLFDDEDEDKSESIDIMEPNMTMELNILDNTITLVKDKNVYADLIKDNDATLLLKTLKNNE